MKTTVIRLLLLPLLLFLPLSVYAEEKETKGTKTELADEAKSAILIERDTGKVLYEKNPHEKLPPASMTKIMTMLLIMEAIDEGKLSYDEKVRTSEYAASMGGSQIFLEPGEEMTVDELLRAIAIGSANDASVAMAERIAGSEEAFVEMMNEKAKELGLKETKFANTTGLPAEGHYSSAYDMAIMARELLKYEGITKYTSKYEDYLRENTDKKFWLVNTNRLVKFYPGVDGLKTGFTSEAGYCLTATAKKNGMRVIAVVFGAPTPKSRNAQITKMLDYAFHHYQAHPVYKRNETVARVDVSKGKQKSVAAVTSEPVSVLTKKGQSVEQIEKVVKVKDGVKAPVRKGDELGVLILKQDGKEILRSPLVAKQTVAEASFWDLFKRVFGRFVQAG
ncbi:MULTISPECIES: D-alanyl-D-alanine carboxypeptidase family protein [Geobacillus]|jgi:D-alanyl-D-alanine carboxypeptidase (penicillin-binding protein 5/6)|uniref:serine-type D-Ala-D-Ala carboxypeptidase n=2 Tax=Geobacillus thermodenitrificans TaxID=33940 RepID=A4IQI7_GEOTN|nr:MULTISPECIES: D-alanyl-D-alanine carboxypeptidase family protein [Geobacillus]ABO67591.1 D-alanyl-D-alanine carboxypeptidase [Geobacillus thermodenitrificans NG80-2]ARP43346.1 D-alanyl-D-alanine carboxypeptidase DacA [Geobacillus thermodenitrificans]ATO38560.1 D-alanyl-D-alanine carboxypeptidase [Geobacillus thermodenitrificans]KQB92801.1 D-alanyl-D-alanine carboxypeptidase DacF [Geobacillus sp. PA-3]MEC5187531.1 D-alanyl-D-alanine carboxypeptidase (penicillin-binding protein 5/6) [Geobacil